MLKCWPLYKLVVYFQQGHSPTSNKSVACMQWDRVHMWCGNYCVLTIHNVTAYAQNSQGHMLDFPKTLPQTLDVTYVHVWSCNCHHYLHALPAHVRCVLLSLQWVHQAEVQLHLPQDWVWHSHCESIGSLPLCSVCMCAVCIRWVCVLMYMYALASATILPRSLARRTVWRARLTATCVGRNICTVGLVIVANVFTDKIQRRSF